MKKKYFAYALSLVLLTSCGKDEIEHVIPQPTTPKEQVDNKPQEGNKDDMKDSNSATDNNNPSTDNNSGSTENNAQQENKLDDYQMGKRSYAQWKATPEVIYTTLSAIDVIEFPAKINAEQLRKLITVFSSDPEGHHLHEFTAQEMQDLTFANLKYDSNGGYLKFNTVYKNVQSASTSWLKFTTQDYFSYHVKTNKPFVSTHYMAGLAQNAFAYVNSLLSYDTDTYGVENVSRSNVDNHSNSFTVSVTFNDEKTRSVLGLYHVTITGFKPLTDLKKDMHLIPTAEFIEFARDKINTRKSKPGGLPTDLSAMFNNTNWIEMLDFRVNNETLVPENHETLYGNRSNQGIRITPRFKVKSAVIKDNNLLIDLQIIQINDETMDDMVYRLVVRNV